MIDHGIEAPGFADPVFDAQSVFRTALTALSEPGRVLKLPSSLGIDAAPALLLALADHDTPIWLDEAASRFSAYLRFHTGAQVIDDPKAARFAMIGSGAICPPLAGFEPGSSDYPDRSATLIVEVETLAEGGGWSLSGPGIPGVRTLPAVALPSDFLSQWADNHASYPQGVDLFFTCGSRLAGLPRSTRVTLCM
jgi:alpha-D-ribose 1-methylphosphonate 5-triphosphate synthase subunit PhnH